MKKLTIITINYNHVDGLRRTIDSIVNQTFTDYEWIVVDGGSTDGSKELIEQYQDHFVWWCSEPDKGVYNAMNKGVAHATGEYINFMNSGDIFATPTILGEIFSKRQTADILFGKMVRETDNGNMLPVGAIMTELEWYDMFYSNLGHQAEFSRRELYQQKKFDETLRMYADWDWNIHMISLKRCRTEYLPLVVAIYEGGGFSETQKSIANEELERLRRKYFLCVKDADKVDFKYLSAVKQHAFIRAICWIAIRISNKLHKLLNR